MNRKLTPKLIATDQPVNLFRDDTRLFHSIGIHPQTGSSVNSSVEGLMIYLIDSNTPIKEGYKPCWCYNSIKNTWDNDLIYYQGAMPFYHFRGFYEILATTDPKLIADGVPSISEEFLKRFVTVQGNGEIMMKWIEDKSPYCICGKSNYYHCDGGGDRCSELEHSGPKLDQSGNTVLTIVPEIDNSICSVCGLIGDYQCKGTIPQIMQRKIDPIEEAALQDYHQHKGGSYAKAAFVRGWKSNPATWTETEVHQLLSKVIYDVTQKQFSMEGCSVSGHRARQLMDEFKKR